MESTAPIRITELVDIDDADLVLMSVVLVITRMLAFTYASPFFGSKTMGRTVRVGFVLALSIILAPPVFTEFKNDPTLADQFVLLVLKELLIGLVLGTLVWMPIHGLELAGVLLDTQRGSTMAQDFNVVFNSPQATPTAILISQIFSGFFFSIGGLLMVETILFDSMAIWPPTEPLPPLQDNVAVLFGTFAGALLFTAIVFALPISGFMLLADIGIAFIARAAPSLNALTLGMPVKSAVLIFMLFFYVDIAFPRLIEGLGESMAVVRLVLQK
ncbi:MAG: flagellar biosynthetic protein FliR [Pseudomonadota bacterium]